MENEKKDLDSIEKIKKFVDLFYEKVKEDTLIGAIFDQKIKGKWEKHLEKIHMFWLTVLLKD